jgi:hypothetical protein
VLLRFGQTAAEIVRIRLTVTARVVTKRTGIIITEIIMTGEILVTILILITIVIIRRVTIIIPTGIGIMTAKNRIPLQIR